MNYECCILYMAEIDGSPFDIGLRAMYRGWQFQPKCIYKTNIITPMKLRKGLVFGSTLLENVQWPIP